MKTSNQKSTSLVSFCIPVYNGEKHILRCIENLQNQHYKNIEIVVLDDASTDNTASIVKGIDDNRIKYYKNAMNKGWRKNVRECYFFASGAFVTIVPVDDYPKEKFAETAVREFQSNNRLGVWACNATTINENNDIICKTDYFGGDKPMKAQDYFNFIYTQKYISPPAESMIRISGFNEVNGASLYNDEYLQYPEMRLYLELANQGYEYYHSSIDLCYRTTRPDSLSSLHGAKAFPMADKIKLYNDYFNYEQLENESKRVAQSSIFGQLARGIVLNIRMTQLMEVAKYLKITKKIKFVSGTTTGQNTLVMIYAKLVYHLNKYLINSIISRLK
jgi:glycosyltransferase involved in cell wall biosynthesis